jgi:hypothetical protein
MYELHVFHNQYIKDKYKAIEKTAGNLLKYFAFLKRILDELAKHVYSSGYLFDNITNYNKIIQIFFLSGQSFMYTYCGNEDFIFIRPFVNQA